MFGEEISGSLFFCVAAGGVAAASSPLAGRVALLCDRGICDAACQMRVSRDDFANVCLRVAQTVALESAPPIKIAA